MFKKITAFLLAFLIILSALPALAVTDYDEVGAYWECCTLYPDFVNKIKDKGATDSQIISFLGSVEKRLLDKEEELSLENFDDYMFDAIKYAFNLRAHIKVRNALSYAYPSSVTEARKGIITEEFMPIYETVKRFLFGITTPVITISVSHPEGEAVVYAHSAYLPENCRFVLALYDEDGTVLHAKTLTPNVEEDGIHCTCENIKSAKLFAWDKASLTPICDPYELIIE